MKHKGDLTITATNIWKYQELTEVSGSVYIHAENASLPALTEVSGYVYISAENASLPALTKVSGSVDISAENASLPALTTSGSVDIRAENASLPTLTEVSGYVFAQPTPDEIAARLAAVAAHALKTPKSLYMNDWHHCKTSHCIAGWAIHLAGEDGYALERKVGPGNAGLMLLGVEAAGHFHLNDEAAREWLSKVAAKSPWPKGI